MKISITSLLLILIFVLSGCSSAYKTYSQRIAISATPKEIFDIDVELRFVSATAVEKRQMKKNLAKKGLIIFTGYTRGMLQGLVLPDKNFIAAIRNFVNKYKSYVNKNEQAIFDEILKALDELDIYLDKQNQEKQQNQ